MLIHRELVLPSAALLSDRSATDMIGSLFDDATDVKRANNIGTV
jgi:hypothetical protein